MNLKHISDTEMGTLVLKTLIQIKTPISLYKKNSIMEICIHIHEWEMKYSWSSQGAGV